MNNRRITLEGLEVLDAIDRKGSFAAAAASLYRVPSKITYTVNKLEEDLGVTLFEKSGRRSVLTAPGRLLLAQGREILEATDRMIESTRQLDRGWESRLHIALDSVFAFETLTPLLSEFCREQPTTEIDVVEEVLGGSWEAITTRRVDLVIGAPDEPVDRRDLRVEPFVAIPWVFAVAKTHALADCTAPVTLDQIRAYRAVVVKDSSREHPALSRRVFDTQDKILVSSVEHKIAAQCAGLGVGFLPRPRAQALIDDGDLIEVPLADPIEPMDSFLVWRRANHGRALRWFVDRLRGLSETL